jgi:hypothetical protein
MAQTRLGGMALGMAMPPRPFGRRASDIVRLCSRLIVLT